MSMNWERFDSFFPKQRSSSYVYRAMVPGGWLVTAELGEGICFYPDPEHVWTVEKDE
mgnify:CR=1 FL=1